MMHRFRGHDRAARMGLRALLLVASSLELVRSDGCNCHDAPGDWIRYAEPLAGTGEEGYLCTQRACCTGKYGSASDGLCCEGNIMNDCCRAKCSGANETPGRAESQCSPEYCTSPDPWGGHDCWAGSDVERCTCSRGSARMTGNSEYYEV